jgi:hypothetical protein
MTSTTTRLHNEKLNQGSGMTLPCTSEITTHPPTQSTYLKLKLLPRSVVSYDTQLIVQGLHKTNFLSAMFLPSLSTGMH